MGRRSTSSLGCVETPYGSVTCRIEKSSYKSRRHFAAHGPTLALHWLFPNKPVEPSQTRMRIVPEDPLESDDEAKAFFEELRAAWADKLESVRPQTVGVEGGPTPTLGQGPTLKVLIAAADRQAAASVRPSTLSAYRFEWKAVCRLIPESTPVGSITRRVVVEALHKDIESGIAPETRRKHAVALKRILDLAVTDGFLQVNPMASLPLPKVPRNQPKFMTFVERDRLLAAAKAEGRDIHLLVACGVFLGLRKAEMLATRWPDLDLDGAVAHVVSRPDFRTKNGQSRTIPICDELMAILVEYRRESGFVLMPGKSPKPGKRYRWDFRTLLNKVITEAGLDPKRVTPHVLRHTFASLSAQRGMSLYKIGQWMGHSATEVTEIYAHLAAYDQDIQLLNQADEPG